MSGVSLEVGGFYHQQDAEEQVDAGESGEYDRVVDGVKHVVVLEEIF